MSTIPSPLYRAAPCLRPAATRLQRARRSLQLQAACALVFDLLVFAVMARLGWELLMPWDRALDAADGLWLVGLLVCGGLWAAFIDQDITRWRRLRRSR